MPFITQCRVCDSTRLEPVINLGDQPWCNHFLSKAEIGNEPFYPLHVLYCMDCTTAQLSFTVPKEIMFGDHTYLSGITKSLNEHFNGIANEVDEYFWREEKYKTVLDIGSNDGTQLKHYQSLGYDVLGIEPSKTTAEIAVNNGVNTINNFFNLELARQLGRKFHVINASGVFFHLEELHSVTEGIREVLREDGVFVIQFLYMKRIVENLAFDQIYHEHLLYYNLHTIEKLLQRHGLELFDAYLSPIHGGSIIGFASHRKAKTPSSRLRQLKQLELEEHSNAITTYTDFARRIEHAKDANLSYLETAKLQGKRVYGFGAPAKGNTLLNYFGIGPDLIECLVEKNKLRRGLYSPGMHIPIILEEEIQQLPDIYYVLAWNFKKEILSNNQLLIERGTEFHFPVNPVENAS